MTVEARISVIFIGALSLWEAVKREWGANGGRFYAGPDTTPERSAQENYIDPHASLRTLPQSIGRRQA